MNGSTTRRGRNRLMRARGFSRGRARTPESGAQTLERDVAEAVTQLTGAADRVVSTPGYMAPEIILQRSVDGRADVYALGCVAYFILTGQEVFQSGTRNRMETLIDHVNASPVRPSERSALPIPPSVDALVLSCLQKDPNDRPQDATEVLKRIDDCHVTGTWSSERAHAWWLKHLPNPAGTLTVAAAAVVAAAS